MLGVVVVRLGCYCITKVTECPVPRTSMRCESLRSALQGASGSAGTYSSTPPAYSNPLSYSGVGVYTGARDIGSNEDP
jgi:hypothetical protein